MTTSTVPRISFVCSSGGAPVFAALDIYGRVGEPPTVCVVTDRICGALEVARSRGLPTSIVRAKNREDLSRGLASELFGRLESDLACMLFGRLVTGDLFEAGPLLNIHPSALPKFPGMSAVEKARKAGEITLGATLHYVDESIDGGPVVARVTNIAPKSVDAEGWQRLSFAQKTYLTLVLFDNARQLLDGAPTESGSTDVRARAGATVDMVRPDVFEEFRRFVLKESIDWEPIDE